MCKYHRKQVVVALEFAEAMMERYLKERGWKVVGDTVFGMKDTWQSPGGEVYHLELAFWAQNRMEDEEEVSKYEFKD